jgi:hypothetical protein
MTKAPPHKKNIICGLSARMSIRYFQVNIAANIGYLFPHPLPMKCQCTKGQIQKNWNRWLLIFTTFNLGTPNKIFNLHPFQDMDQHLWFWGFEANQEIYQQQQKPIYEWLQPAISGR